MAALSALQSYAEDDDSSDEELASDQAETSTKRAPLLSDRVLHLVEPTSSSELHALSINAAPTVNQSADRLAIRKIDPDAKELTFNAKYEELFAPEIGPDNPFKTDQQKANKNVITGFVEPATFNQFQFETQRRTFHSFGYAQNPSVTANESQELVGNPGEYEKNKGVTVFEKSKPRPLDSRKRERNMDPSDVDGYTGPWGKFVDETTVSKPDEATLKEMEEYVSKKKKKVKTKLQLHSDAPEKTILHIKDPYDYQGRSFLHIPTDVGVNLRTEDPPEHCFVPKKLIHTWSGHAKGVQAIRWFPVSAHLLLSCGMDSKLKLFEVYKQRRCVRSYMGHNQAVRDACFNSTGSEFLSTAYDRYIKLWDTETGQVRQKFTTGKVAYCVKFNPDVDKQHMFLSGMDDKKIIQWDTRTGEMVQEYDRHLGPVNSITFFDRNRRFVSTSDDKSMRIWEWEIPVDTKLIQDAGLHSLPAMTLSPNQKWMVGQAMDNKIMIFQLIEEKLRFSKRKAFRGHMCAGYACSVDFSPDMGYVVSGDADGKIFVWDWKTHRIKAKWKAHDKCSIGVLWHPHETSKIASCSWDGSIKFWD